MFPSFIKFIMQNFIGCHRRPLCWNLLTACDRSSLSYLPRQYTGLLRTTVKQQMQQQQQCWDYSFYTSFGWLKFAYVKNPVPLEMRHVTYKLHSHEHSCFYFFYTSGTLHARHIRTHFELWGRPFCLSLLASFFLPFGVAMKGIQSIQLHCHISFLLFVWLTTYFYPARDGCWIHINVGCSACIYSIPLVISLNDEPRLAHWR